MNPSFHILDTPISETDCRTIAKLFELCFGRQPDANFSTRLNGKPQLIAMLAEVEGEPVAFKIGYEKYPGIFFSWLGGVLPSNRRSGIARQLLQKQHDWCVSRGYDEIQTETFGDVPEMLILNLAEGFQVFGTYLSSDGRIRVQLRKTLIRHVAATEQRP